MIFDTNRVNLTKKHYVRSKNKIVLVIKNYLLTLLL